MQENIIIKYLPSYQGIKEWKLFLFNETQFDQNVIPFSVSKLIFHIEGFYLIFYIFGKQYEIQGQKSMKYKDGITRAAFYDESGTDNVVSMFSKAAFVICMI